MFLEIELVYFLVMIAVFVVALVVFKVHAGLALMLSAVVGALISGNGIPFRHLMEGTFGYFDTLMIIITAMIFMQGLQESGALKYLTLKILDKLYNKPILLLLSLMLVLMFPGMITGSSLAAIVSSGVLLAPIMIKLGIPKVKVGAMIAFCATLGMVAPPINVPVMVICDIVDMPYIGFTMPLLLLSLPLAVFTTLFFGYKHVRKVDYELIRQEIEDGKKENLHWTVIIPLLVLVVLIVGQNVFPQVLGKMGLPLVFVISALLTVFFGKKANLITISKEGVYKSFGAIALLMGVGMFVQIITLNGVRGYFVINALSLPNVLQIVSIGVTLPLFGGISAFGSASVLGGPFVMAMLSSNQIVVASSLSLIASLGEFLPPTAMSATFSAKAVDEEKYLKITKISLIPLGVSLVYGLLFVSVIAQLWR
jgi:TRAP-type C4-dicarboxylate transport system permease large subunit